MDAKLPGSDMRYFAQNVVSRTWQVCLPASFAESQNALTASASEATNNTCLSRPWRRLRRRFERFQAVRSGWQRTVRVGTGKTLHSLTGAAFLHATFGLRML